MNIYHVLNSMIGDTMATELITAMKLYKGGNPYYRSSEDAALASLRTMWNCDLFDYKEYMELREQLLYLMRLYRGLRGSALGRKDVK